MQATTLMTMTLTAALLFAGAAQAETPCPQPRKTKAAPATFAKMAIPKTADAAAGKRLFQKSAKPMACQMCHGKNGGGGGKLGKALKPSPRAFTCKATMRDVSPGQMFWIIKNGSKGTGMVSHAKTLSDRDIWNVIRYVRTEFMKE